MEELIYGINAIAKASSQMIASRTLTLRFVMYVFLVRIEQLIEMCLSTVMAHKWRMEEEQKNTPPAEDILHHVQPNTQLPYKEEIAVGTNLKYII